MKRSDDPIVEAFKLSVHPVEAFDAFEVTLHSTLADFKAKVDWFRAMVRQHPGMSSEQLAATTLLVDKAERALAMPDVRAQLEAALAVHKEMARFFAMMQLPPDGIAG